MSLRQITGISVSEVSQAEGEPDDRDALLQILLAGAPYGDEGFFPATTTAMTTALHVKLAFISELLLDQERARVVAVSTEGQPGEPMEYTLEGTPCKEVALKGTGAYHESVAIKFPTDQWLIDVGAEAYAATLLTASSGDPIGLLGIVHDSPLPDLRGVLSVLAELAPRVAAEMERRQLHHALRRNEATLRLLTEHSRDIMFYFQRAPIARVEYINPAVEEILGVPPEAVQANPDNAMQFIHEEDRAQLLRALSLGTEETLVARVVRPDGELRWIECRNFGFHDEQDRLIAVGGNVRDITRRLQVEEALRTSERYTRALLEAIPDTVFRLGEDGALLDYVAGEVVREVLAAENRIIGRNIRDLLPAQFVTPAKRLIQSALRTGRLQRLEFEVKAGAESKYFEARCLPFGDDEVLLILRDFTAVKWHQGEDERRRFRDELDSKVERRIHANPYGLTYRELAILHLVAEGSADKQIAESLAVSTYTVNKHVGNILGKMNAASRTEAGVRAIREGLLG